MMQNGVVTSNKGRLEYIDMLRGLMLVIMTFDHLGGPIKKITFQPLGFVSAAAGFIYLSGFIYGVVYTRRYFANGFETIKIKSVRRAAVIYFYHLVILIIIAIPLFLGLDFEEELRVFIEKPAQSFLLFALLLNQPSNMDILPMYIIFILLAPFVLRAILAGKWKAVLAVSFLLWLFNQIPFLQYNRYDVKLEKINLGFFNILSWQIIFFTGVFFGYAKAVGKKFVPVTRLTIILAIAGAVLLFLIRHMPTEMRIYGLFARFADRSTLGVVRLTNFLILAYLIYILTIRYPGVLKSRWLSLLGTHSVQVYAYSVCIVYFIMLVGVIDYQKNPCTSILVDVIIVATLTLPAWLHKFVTGKFILIKKYGL